MFPAQRGVSALYDHAFTGGRSRCYKPRSGAQLVGARRVGRHPRGEPAEHEWNVEGKGEIRAGCHVEKGARGQQTPRAAK